MIWLNKLKKKRKRKNMATAGVKITGTRTEQEVY
jgi:hypothetical protein